MCHSQVNRAYIHVQTSSIGFCYVALPKTNVTARSCISLIYQPGHQGQSYRYQNMKRVPNQTSSRNRKMRAYAYTITYTALYRHA